MTIVIWVRLMKVLSPCRHGSRLVKYNAMVIAAAPWAVDGIDKRRKSSLTK